MKVLNLLTDAFFNTNYSAPKSCVIALDDFRRICTDSRTLNEGDIFLPIVGENFDGHSYIADAIEQGASWCFCENNYFEKYAEFQDQLIVVEDSINAFQRLARSYLEHMPTKKIAITGSAGKTTMKNLIGTICAEFGNTISTPKSFNNEIGVPKTIQLVDEKTEYAVFELAARHKEDIRILTEIVRPDVALCINVGTAHLGEFGSIETLFNTKMEIYSFSPASTHFIYNFDDQRIVTFLAKFSNRKTSFGLGSGSDFHSSEHNESKKKIDIDYQGQTYQVNFNYSHHTNPINAAAALATANAMGFDLIKSAASLSKYKEDKGRYSIKETDDGIIFIDDSYNANPESMKYGLLSVRDSYERQEKLLILGDMLELGPQSADLHKTIAPILSSIPNVGAIFTVGQDSLNYVGDKDAKTLHEHFSSVAELKEYIEEDSHILKSIDVIYIKSSLGVGLHGYADSLFERLGQ